MNSAKLSKSKRLQRVAAVLKDRRWHSTREIMQDAKVCAVNSCVSELRANSKAIKCRRRGSRDNTVFEYRMV